MDFKKDRLSSFVLAAFILCMVGLFCVPSTTSSAPTTTPNPKSTSTATKLRMCVWYPPTHTYEKILEEMARKIATATEGRVLIEIHHSGTLVKASDQLLAVEKGIVDMAHDVPYFNASSIPVLGLGLLPGIWQDDVTALLGLRECIPVLEQALQEKGYKNIRIARMLGGSNSTFLNTRDKLVKVPSDLKGMKLRSTGPLVSAAFKRMGAAPLIMPTAEVYENLARNLIDGAVSYLGSTIEYQLHEVTKYGTILPLGHSIQGVIMNRQSLNKLSQPDRELVAEFAAAASSDMGLTSSVQRVRDIAFNKKMLKELYTPTPEEMKLWNEALNPSIDEWTKQAGPLGNKIVEILRRWNVTYPVKY